MMYADLEAYSVGPASVLTGCNLHDSLCTIRDNLGKTIRFFSPYNVRRRQDFRVQGKCLLLDRLAVFHGPKGAMATAKADILIVDDTLPNLHLPANVEVTAEGFPYRERPGPTGGPW